jgi:hypothetical protein
MHIDARVVRALAGVLVVSSAAALGAQARPDFSGEWVLNRRGSTLPPHEAGFTRLTDGTESSETGPQGLTTVSTLRWDGTELVLAMRIKGPGFEATNDVRDALVEEGRRLRAIEQGRGPRGSHDAVWIYDRR